MKRAPMALIVMLMMFPTFVSRAAADGIDISFPQCGQTVPAGADFTIIGVNGGKPFTPDNPCLAVQVASVGTTAQFYANTANPGPLQSSFWPNGLTLGSRQCNTPAVPGADTIDCAYIYGWNAATNSYGKAVAAQAAAGLPMPVPGRTAVPADWWLDVEQAGVTGNSWRDVPTNLATLEGAVDALNALGARRVGFYANPTDWQTVTGNSPRFAGYAFWYAGLGSRDVAVGRCGGVGLTGGGVALAQYANAIQPPGLGLDGNVPCPVELRFPPPVTVRAGSAVALPLELSVVQGQPTGVQLTVNGDGSLQVATAANPAGLGQSLFETVPARTRELQLIARGTRAGRYSVFAVSDIASAAGRAIVTVTPAAAKTIRRITGPRTITRGGRRVLQVVAFDRFDNRVRAIRWTSSDPAIASVRLRSDGNAIITARRRGTVTIRANAGSLRTPGFRVQVR